MKKGFWKGTNPVSLLCWASIVYKEERDARELGNLSRLFWFIYKPFKLWSLPIYSGRYVILLLFRLRTLISFSNIS